MPAGVSAATPHARLRVPPPHCPEVILGLRRGKSAFPPHVLNVVQRCRLHRRTLSAPQTKCRHDSCHMTRHGRSLGNQLQAPPISAVACSCRVGIQLPSSRQIHSITPNDTPNLPRSDAPFPESNDLVRDMANSARIHGANPSVRCKLHLTSLALSTRNSISPSRSHWPFLVS
jgi:hypothetical protein